MTNKIILSFVVCLPFLANAQTFRVEKVSKGRAIVAVSGGSVQVGESYNVGGGSGMYGATSTSGGGGSRSKVIGLSGEFSNLSSAVSGGTSTSTTVMALRGQFGWNQVAYEYGGLVSYNNTSTSGTSTSSYSLGAFGDYNFTENKEGVSTVWGAGGQFLFGSATTSGSSTSNSYTEFFAGGHGKFFMLGTTTAIRVDLGYKMQKYNTNPAVTVSGIAAIAGLYHYF